MSRRSYGNGRRRRSRNRYAGPDFGKLYKEKKSNRLLGFFVVLLISAGIGVGAYFVADYHLDKKEAKSENTTPTPVPEMTPVVTQEPEITPDVTGMPTSVYPDGFMADFVDTRERVDAKGIYVNTAYLGRGDYPTIDELIEMLDETELNAMVIDIKDDVGSILFDAQHPLVNEIGSETLYIRDLPAFVGKLKEHDIYCIARIVCFKDQVATMKNPELAVRNHDGSIYVDKEGERWLNPYSEKAWEYIVEVAKEAAEAGFDEINFDYLRTSASGSFTQADFGGLNEGKTKIDAITGFVKYACQELKPMGVFVSGDVFGTIINSKADGESIGQSYVELSRYLDYICPMVYPSHYSFGYAGLKYPDTKPFQLLLTELKSSVKKLSVIPEEQHCAEVRPWLQDFTASYLGAGRYATYGPQEIRAQISATYSAGYDEWLLWNAAMFFTEEGMLRDKDQLEAELREETESKE
ncbi:MAG: putative glycoside hydrolase [Lachnospiraceae bacterium]|nr:putative glycoside hydrolase [Lachnospiraceae bacterium]